MPKKTIKQLDSLLEVFKDCKFDDFSILGLSFFFSIRLAFVMPEDREEQGAQDAQEFSGNRFNNYIDIDFLSELNSRFSEELLDKVFLDITSCFVSFAYHLNLKLSEGRLNMSGEKTQIFNPVKVFELSKIEPEEIQQLSDIHELYSEFFFVLGRVLNQSNCNFKESFALSNLFGMYAAENDQVGFSEIVQLSLKNTPPLYGVILEPLYHKSLFDENGLKGDRLMPFQIALTGFLRGIPEETCEFIWNEQRRLFYNQETLKPINIDFQFISIKNSEVLFDHYYESVILRFKNYFLSSKGLLDAGGLVSFKVENNESRYDFIYSLIREKWGFDVDKDQSISSNITFFAIFFHSFLCWSIENLKDNN